MASESVVKRINRINSNVTEKPNKKAAEKKNKATQSRIAVAGSRNYRFANSTAKKKKPSKKQRNPIHAKLIALVGVAVIFIIGITYLFWYNSFTNIKLEDYATVAMFGYNNYGQAKLSIASDMRYTDFFDTVSGSLNISDNLSNGDEVVVTYSYDETVAKDSKLRIDATDTLITVDGLEDALVINKDKLFDGLQVSFNDLSPCMGVELENISDDELLSNVTYELVGDKHYFSSGDTIQVQAILPEGADDNHAYVFELSDSDFVQSYSAPTGDSYFTSASQVTPDILNQLERGGLELISKADAKEYGLRIFQQEAHLQPVFVGNRTTFQWINPYAISAYFHSVTESGKEITESHANDVQIVYGVTLTQQDGTSCQAEIVVQFVNLIAKEDGSVDMGLDSGRIVSASHRNSNIKNLVSGTGDGMYETTKLTD